MSDERMSKLPKWAQQLITKLTADAKYATKQLKQIGVDGDSKVALRIDVLTWLHLPSDSRLSFTLENGRRLEVFLNREGELEVYGTEQLIVHPQVSNIVSIGAKDR